MYTVITKGNEVHRVTNPTKFGLVDNIMIIDDSGTIANMRGNPITWPTNATDGLQAIVDIKAGTLRFGMNNGPISRDEYVVSEYVAPVTSAPHIFDLIDCWPDQRNRMPGLSAPEGWEWKYFGDDWVLSNGLVGLKHDEWFKYKHCESEPAKPFDPFVSIEDCDLAQCDSEIRMFNEKFGDKKPVNPATTKQSAPKGKGNPILGMVLADLTNRALEGKEKYGEPLLANNGRNALWDAYQEALDLAMYLRQAIEEQERS